MRVTPIKSKISRLEQVIIHSNLISHAQFEEATIASQKLSQPLLPYILHHYTIKPVSISQACANYFGLPHLELHNFDLESLPMSLINLSEHLVQNRAVLPLSTEDDRLQVAIADPDDISLLDDIQFQTHLDTQAIMVPYDQLTALINRLRSAKNYNLVTRFEQNSSQNPAVTFVEQMLSDAIHRNASDIHCEPFLDHYRVRMRIDGLLYEITQAPITLSSAFTCRLKVMGQCDISERRLPQDGRFTFVTPSGQSRDCRLSSCPTLFGEKLVIRLLDPNKKLLNINELGIDAKEQSLLIAALEQPQGLILVTGPTGSGKTISLYTALEHLNRRTHNISTVEEPVEIQLPGINQVNINEKAGLTFATVLRAFLRQDPDVIMLGEIRDKETADIAIRAAQTGHLVLSTLHTNSAADSLIRLINMGVAPFNVASSIRLIMAQRLVRKLCQHCKQPQTIPLVTLKQAGFSQQNLSSIQLYQSKGCQYCVDGYQGRIGIFEIMPISKTLSNLILHHGAQANIAKHAEQEGIQSLWQVALNKAKQGVTSLTEVYRVVPQPH